jgi:hypothetical protein
VEPLTTKETVETVEEVDKEKQWLEHVQAKRIESIGFIVSCELSGIKSQFETVCGHGEKCVINFRSNSYREETFVRLREIGFTLELKIAQRCCKDCPLESFAVSLPRVSLMKGNDPDLREWRHWVRKTKHRYEKARKQLIYQQYEHLKSEFERVAVQGYVALSVTNKLCYPETAKRFKKRLGCTVVTCIDGQRFGYVITLPQ